MTAPLEQRSTYISSPFQAKYVWNDMKPVQIISYEMQMKTIVFAEKENYMRYWKVNAELNDNQMIFVFISANGTKTVWIRPMPWSYNT